MAEKSGSISKKKRRSKRTDWGSVRSFAFGELGLSLEDYANTTLFEYDLKCIGYRDKVSRERKDLRKIHWAVIKMMGKPEDTKSLSAEQLWPIDEADFPKQRRSITKSRNFNDLIQKFNGRR